MLGQISCALRPVVLDAAGVESLDEREQEDNGVKGATANIVCACKSLKLKKQYAVYILFLTFAMVDRGRATKMRKVRFRLICYKSTYIFMYILRGVSISLLAGRQVAGKNSKKDDQG